MKIDSKILLIVLLFFSLTLFAQKSRTAAMGGLSFSIRDLDESFDPYTLGGNTAWLAESQKNARLEITPLQNSSYGTYRRKYTAERINNYGVHFLDLKPLGVSGTFLGEALYDYQIRVKNYRNLKFNPYAGEGFFFTDTTTGNTTYKGPMFRLSHSLRIYKNLYAGGGVRYQILNGLKDVYTFGETVYRNVEGDLGLAYQFSGGIIIGASVHGTSSQERIEASDVNLLTVRTFEWRGETHAVELRGSSQKYKITKAGEVFSGQIYYHPDEKLEIGVAADYGISGSRFLYPEGSLVDVEDGYASFDITDIKARARYQVTEKLLAALSLGYTDYKSWSENSKRNLLIWEWRNRGAVLGFGGSYNVNKNFLIGVEIETEFISSDSSKYIDNRFRNIDVTNNTARIGLEYYISNDLALRSGYNFLSLAHDFLFGGDNVTEHLLTFGFGYNINDDIQLNGMASFAERNGGEDKVYRSYLNWLFSIRFFTF